MSKKKRPDRLALWAGVYGALGLVVVLLSVITTPFPPHSLVVGALMLGASVGAFLKRRIGLWLAIALVPPGLVFSLFTLGSALMMRELAGITALVLLALVPCVIMVLVMPFLLASKRSELK